MSESLSAIFDGRRVGTLHYNRDRLHFEYDEAWREDRASFPLSLSMPLTHGRHEDTVIRSFISGLLPDDSAVLRGWGQRYQVSARNPFRLLSHVGEECAGAVQFVRPDDAGRWLSEKSQEGIDWLSEEDLIERVADLMADRSRARRLDDEGQFSLAGAQAKTGLYLDSKSNRWGIPKEATPTTHILKPNIGAFDHYDLNEHFCLQLAHRLGLQTARSWTQKIGEIPVIIVERFDRAEMGGRIMRIHQEDCCQALAQMPETKYQNQGGPSARDIFSLIRDYSSRFEEDVNRFLDSIIYNWLIGGTDAHAKNYGFLLAGAGQVRLAPLYDISSCLPYPRAIPLKKAKLAMKIGGEYLLDKVKTHQWEKAASDWKIDKDLLFDRVSKMTKIIPEASIEVDSSIKNLNKSERDFLKGLTAALRARANRCHL